MTQTLIETGQTPQTRRIDWRRILGQLGPFIGIIFVVALFGALSPKKFLTLANMEVILLQAAVVGVAALGMTMIIISGGIDLSVGSNIAVSCVTTAIFLRDGHPASTAALAGIGAGTASGLLIGVLVTSLRLSPFIVTLGLWGALRGVAKLLADERSVSAPATWLNSLMGLLPQEDRWMIARPGVWIMLALAVFTALLLRYTRFGRHIFAIGSNEQTARLCGVPVVRTKILVYAIAGALTGLAGVLQFASLTIGDPATAKGYELDIIAAVVIGGASLSGGQGSVLGTLMGAIMMSAVFVGCSKLRLPNYYQEIATGVIIILAVALDRLQHRRT